MNWPLIFDWLLGNLYAIIGLTILFIYRKRLIWDPLAGGNGVVQMDEIAKALILGVFVLAAKAEADRSHEYHVFSDAFWFAILGAVCIIAGLKAYGSKLFDKFKSKDKTE